MAASSGSAQPYPTYEAYTRLYCAWCAQIRLCCKAIWYSQKFRGGFPTLTSQWLSIKANTSPTKWNRDWVNQSAPHFSWKDHAPYSPVTFGNFWALTLGHNQSLVLRKAYYFHLEKGWSGRSSSVGMGRFTFGFLAMKASISFNCCWNRASWTHDNKWLTALQSKHIYGVNTPSHYSHPLR